MNSYIRKPVTRLSFSSLRQSDIPTVWRLLEHYLPDYAGIPREKLPDRLRTWPAGILSTILQKRAYCIVAKDGAAIAGLLIYSSDAKKAHINLVLVTPRYKRQGLSKDLVILFSRIIQKFLKTFSLDVTNSNKKAFAVYRHYEQMFLLRRSGHFQDHAMGRRTNFVGKSRRWAALRPKRPALSCLPRRPEAEGLAR